MTGQPPDDETTAEPRGLPQPRTSESAQPRDLRELLASEFLDRLRAGEQVTVEMYARQHPALADELRNLLPLVAALEDWKSHRRARPVDSEFPEDFRIDRLGDCRIIREVGRGGMGVVFEAIQEPPSRRVAVKLLPARLGRDPRWRRQFEQEARIAAGLRHANIVPVYSFGEHDGCCYYVMPFISGVGLDWIIHRLRDSDGVIFAEEVAAAGPLEEPAATDRQRSSGPTSAGPPPATEPDEEVADGLPVTPQRRLRRDSWRGFAKIGAQVAAALRYAHGQRLLHRDIKPANVLLDVRGVVRITDFGLARMVDAGESGPGTPAEGAPGSSVAGTLRYMAPEQLAGDTDERSDLYALGVTLYELLTQQPAFTGEMRVDIRRAIEAGIARSPIQLNPHVPPELDAIVMKAAEVEPDRRYASAAQMLDDLMRYLQHQPVQALSTGFLAGWRRRGNRSR